MVLHLRTGCWGLRPANTLTPRTAALLDWYAVNRRELPWRDESDPYRVLVSEVMLQQTQASRVVSHYRSFVERFPTVQALADGAPADVLAAWQGLGYNRRAIRLHEAARQIAADGWPPPGELDRLPGVGPYTAAAVACFAFGTPVAAPDTNARRVLSRWEGRALSGRSLWEEAARRLPPEAAAAWNQALMDLGSAVCRPRRPSCDRCPVAAWCTDPSVYEPPRPQGRFCLLYTSDAADDSSVV